MIMKKEVALGSEITINSKIRGASINEIRYESIWLGICMSGYKRAPGDYE